MNLPTIATLEDGLTVIAQNLPVDAVNFNLWSQVGSRLETPDISGMAHFLEHMVFKGTDRLALGEFERKIESRGAITNAATSHDYTHFYLTCAPSDLADLAPLQMDVVMNPSVPTAEFDREKQVVLEEIRRSDDNPQRRNYQRLAELLFPDSPYRHPVLGTPETVGGISAEAMRSFHDNYYHPHRLTAVVVGDVVVEEAIDIVRNSVDRISRNPQDASPMNTFTHPETDDLTPFETIERRKYTDADLQQGRLYLAWRTPGTVDLAETYALDAIAAIVGQGRTSRLVRQLREEEHLVSSISASNVTYYQQGYFVVSAHLPAENLAIAEAKIRAQIERWQTELVAPAELQKVAVQVANRHIFGSETPGDRANLYGYYQTVIGNIPSAFDYPRAMRALTPEDLRHAAQKYLSPEAFGVLTIDN
jgi:predicted Zn-dependent peptidase